MFRMLSITIHVLKEIHKNIEIPLCIVTTIQFLYFLFNSFKTYYHERNGIQSCIIIRRKNI
jgi:hypothetical protein